MSQAAWPTVLGPPLHATPLLSNADAGQWGVNGAGGMANAGVVPQYVRSIDNSNSQSVQQAALATPSGIAKRKCGRPKAPNPLEDPTIPEKKARRIMANRASADRSKQRQKIAAAEAKARLSALHDHLTKVCQQMEDAHDCMCIVEVVQAAVVGTPPGAAAVRNLNSQLQRDSKPLLPLPPMPEQQRPSKHRAAQEQLESPGPPSQPLQQQEQQMPPQVLPQQLHPAASDAMLSQLPQTITRAASTSTGAGGASVAGAPAAVAAAAVAVAAAAATLAAQQPYPMGRPACAGPDPAAIPAPAALQQQQQHQQEQLLGALANLQRLLVPLQQPEQQQQPQHYDHIQQQPQQACQPLLPREQQRFVPSTAPAAGGGCADGLVAWGAAQQQQQQQQQLLMPPSGHCDLHQLVGQVLAQAKLAAA